MKKEFVSISLIVSMICMSSTYTAEEERAGAEVRFLRNNAVENYMTSGKMNFGKDKRDICLWRILRPDKPNNLDQRTPCVDRFSENCIFFSPDGEEAFRIRPKGELIVNGRKQNQIAVKNASGEIILDTAQDMDKGLASADCRNIVLESGDAGIFDSYDDGWTRRLRFTYDRVDGLKYPVSSFHLLENYDPTLIRWLAINDKQLPHYFLELDKDGKEQLMDKLSICKLAELRERLDKIGLDYKEDFVQSVRRKFQKKADDLLTNGKCQGIDSLTITMILSNHIPHDLVEEVQDMKLSLDSRIVEVFYTGDRKEVVCLGDKSGTREENEKRSLYLARMCLYLASI